MDAAQVVIAVFLLLLGGAGAFVMGRLTKIGDALSAAQTDLAVALNDIVHLKDKTATHTGHIDTLFEMKTMMAEMGVALKHVAETQPEMLKLMNQLAAIAIRKAA